MKQIHRFNLFAVRLPILLGLVGIIFNDFLFYAAISTVLMGFIQVILGLFLFFDNPKDANLKIYLGSVIGYFLLFFIVGANNLGSGIFTVILAIYLTIFIFKKITL